MRASVAHRTDDGLKFGPARPVPPSIARTGRDGSGRTLQWPDYRKHRFGEDARSATCPWNNLQFSAMAPPLLAWGGFA